MSDETEERPEFAPLEESRWKRTVRWVADWWIPLAVFLAFWIISAFSIREVGWWPTILVLAFSPWFFIIMWVAIKIYYHRIMVIDYEPSSDSMVIGRVMVPMDIAPDIEISGPRGQVRDFYGQTYDIVKTFDTETLQGEGTWDPEWHPLRAMAHMGFAYQVVKHGRELIWQFSDGMARAEENFLADRSLAAAEKSFRRYAKDSGVKANELVAARQMREDRYKKTQALIHAAYNIEGSDEAGE